MIRNTRLIKSHTKKWLHKNIGWISVVLGLMVLVGWWTEVEILKCFIPGQPAMKITTAICFVLLGISYEAILIYKRPILKRTGHVCLLACSIISLYAIYLIFEFPNLPRSGAQKNISNDSFMPILTAICFLLSCFSCWTFAFKKQKLRAFSQLSSHVLFFISFVAFLCFIYSIKLDSLAWFLYPMSVPTIILFVMYAVSFSILIPEYGLARALNYMPVSKKVAINFSLYITVIILVIGYLNIYLIKNSILPYDFASILTRVLAIFSIAIFIVLTAGRLDKLERNEIYAKNQLLYLNNDLEKLLSKVNSSAFLQSKNVLTKSELSQLIKQTQCLIDEVTDKNEILEEFSDIISHDLRAPLANLSSLLALYEDEKNQEERRTIFDHCKTAIFNMNRLLDAMMVALKVNHERNISEEVSLKEVFDTVVLNLKSTIDQSKAIIHHDFSRLPIVNCNHQYLSSIFQNLIANAIRYRSKDRIPLIKIESSLVDKSAILKVCDNGIGMDLKKVGSELFGLFKTFTDHPESKGLGLYIVEKQVRKMGGSIDVYSKPDEGTTFTITLNQPDSGVL